MKVFPFNSKLVPIYVAPILTEFSRATVEK